MYDMSVHGAPQKPITGTAFPQPPCEGGAAASRRVRAMPSNRGANAAAASGRSARRDRSAGPANGLGNTGPGSIRTSNPIACGTIKMSLKITTASSVAGKRRSGCSVASAHSAGVLHTWRGAAARDGVGG